MLSWNSLFQWIALEATCSTCTYQLQSFCSKKIHDRIRFHQSFLQELQPDQSCCSSTCCIDRWMRFLSIQITEGSEIYIKYFHVKEKDWSKLSENNLPLVIILYMIWLFVCCLKQQWLCIAYFVIMTLVVLFEIVVIIIILIITCCKNKIIDAIDWNWNTEIY